MRPEAGPAGREAPRRVRRDPAGASGGAGRAALALALAALLGGCAALDPAGWFHKQEGGVIAQQKEPLPGADRPYPNLASVPPAPAPADLKALRQITAGLVADRENAHLQAQAAPLPDPSQPSTAPGLFGVGTLPPPVPPPAGGLSATLPAVSTPGPAGASPAPAPSAAPARPEAPPQPPAKAPVAPVKSAELAPPAMPAPTPAPTPAPSPAKPAAAPEAAAGPPPAIPAAPPAPPKLTGPAGGAGMVAAPAAPASAAVTADMVRVEFPPGSATVPPAAVPALRALAARRASRGITVTGYGDASGTAPTAQAAAVSLGLARARAIAAALAADGVPSAALRVLSVAAGQGGSARLE